MKYLIFIQSLKPKEWEVGEIIAYEIAHNPKYVDCHPCLFLVNNYQEVLDILINEKYMFPQVTNEDAIVIQIDAHSNENGLYFYDKNLKSTSYIKWQEFNNLLNLLYSKYGENILVILVSCLSAPFFQKIDSPHIKIIAADNIVSPRRAEEQLLKFYNSFCTGKCFEQAYDDMIKAFPVEDELKRESKEKSILRFLK